MQIVVINSQKGGSGKTMLAKHLAVEAERAGDGPVFLIDTDRTARQPNGLAHKTGVRDPSAGRESCATLRSGQTITEAEPKGAAACACS